jgi:NADPH:quinone reductase-like Zn-dependent oxidoreductase
MGTMNAVRIHSFGGGEVLAIEEVPLPVPKAGEIVVRISAAGVNPIDWKTRRGQGVAHILDRPLPVILGWDFAGTVVARGPCVSRFADGDAVFGMVQLAREGTYADYVALPAAHAARKPEKLTFEEAASLPLASLTAWQTLVGAAHLSRGQTVVVHAAAGGVGHLAVQIAKARGAKVMATASTSHHEFVKSLGADVVVDDTKERFEHRLQGAEVVLDTVGGETQERSFGVLKPGGVLVSTVSRPDTRLARRGRVHVRWLMVTPNGDQLAKIASMVDHGDLRPFVSRVLPIADARSAHEQSELGHALGKIVLRVAGGWDVGRNPSLYPF